MLTTNKFSIILSVFISLNASAMDRIYYGDGIKDVLVNSQDPTLLLFPSPPIARICHPSGIVDFFPIENPEDVTATTLTNIEWGNTKTAPEGNLTEKMLKLTPYKESQTTLCDIKLATNETVTVRIKPVANLKRPAIEFQNVFSLPPKRELSSYDQTSLEVFKRILTGGELVEFYDITASKDLPVSVTSKIAKYEVLYIGTDKDKYKAWIIRANFKTEILTPPILKGVKLNEIFFSAWKPLQGIYSQTKWKRDETTGLFILSSNDLSTEELLEKLP